MKKQILFSVLPATCAIIAIVFNAINFPESGRLSSIIGGCISLIDVFIGILYFVVTNKKKNTEIGIEQNTDTSKDNIKFSANGFTYLCLLYLITILSIFLIDWILCAIFSVILFIPLLFVYIHFFKKKGKLLEEITPLLKFILFLTLLTCYLTAFFCDPYYFDYCIQIFSNLGSMLDESALFVFSIIAISLSFFSRFLLWPIFYFKKGPFTIKTVFKILIFTFSTVVFDTICFFVDGRSGFFNKYVPASGFFTPFSFVIGLAGATLTYFIVFYISELAYKNVTNNKY